jgi:ABC-type polysaccharide/polyol phosphate transport system ATPase subunit
VCDRAVVLRSGRLVHDGDMKGAAGHINRAADQESRPVA